LVKQRRSTSEGPGSRDATLNEIVDQLGGDKAESQQLPDGSPSQAHQDEYLDARALRMTQDPRRPLGRDQATEIKRLTIQNDKLRKQLDLSSKEKREIELEKNRLLNENQQLRNDLDRESHRIKEGCKSVQNREIELLKAQHDKQMHSLNVEHEKDVLKQKGEWDKEMLKQKVEHEKEVAKIQSYRSREKAESKDLIWRLEAQLKLDKNAQALLCPAEASRILRVREDNSSARNVELEFENAMLRDDVARLSKEHQRTQLRLQMTLEQIGRGAGSESSSQQSQASIVQQPQSAIELWTWT